MQRLQELVLYQRGELKNLRPDHGQGTPLCCHCLDFKVCCSPCLDTLKLRASLPSRASTSPFLCSLWRCSSPTGEAPGHRVRVDLDKLEKPLLASEVATVITLALVWVLSQKYSMKSIFTDCLLQDSVLSYTVFAPCGGQNIKSQRQGFPEAHSWLTQRYERQLRSRLGNLIQSGKESAPVLDCDVRGAADETNSPHEIKAPLSNLPKVSC